MACGRVDNPGFDIGDQAADGARMGTSVGELEDVRYGGSFGEAESQRQREATLAM